MAGVFMQANCSGAALKTARLMLDKFTKATQPRDLCWKYIDNFVGELTHVSLAAT